MSAPLRPPSAHRLSSASLPSVPCSPPTPPPVLVKPLPDGGGTGCAGRGPRPHPRLSLMSAQPPVKRPGLHICSLFSREIKALGSVHCTGEVEEKNARARAHSVTLTRVYQNPGASAHPQAPFSQQLLSVQGPALTFPPFRWEAGRGEGGAASTGRCSWPNLPRPHPGSDPSLHLGCGQRRQRSTAGWPSSPWAPGSA